MCSPPLATVSSAVPASVLVLASTQPPVTLCLTALSMRLLTSRSSRTRSPRDLGVLQRGVDPDLPGRGGRGDQVDRVFDRGRQVDQLGRAWSAVGAGQGQQRLDQFLGPVHGGADRGQHRFQLRGGGGRPGRGDVDQGAHLGQRRAQLVRGVGHEPALAGERGFQPGEHRVEGVGEFLELIGWTGQCQPAVQVLLRGGLRRRGDGGQRPKHPAADGPAESGGQQGAQAQPGQCELQEPGRVSRRLSWR